MDSITIKNIDALIEQFWKKGYLTVSRKFGKYLPEPTPIGGYDVDVIAKYKNSFAIGIVLKESDFSDVNKIKERIIYLASRHTKFSKKSVSLYVGVSSINFFRLKQLISDLPENLRKNIFIVQLYTNDKSSDKKKDNFTGRLFS